MGNNWRLHKKRAAARRAVLLARLSPSRSLHIEPLERRWMLSADVSDASVLLNDAPPITAPTVMANSGPTDSSPQPNTTGLHFVSATLGDDCTGSICFSKSTQLGDVIEVDFAQYLTGDNSILPPNVIASNWQIDPIAEGGILLAANGDVRQATGVASPQAPAIAIAPTIEKPSRGESLPAEGPLAITVDFSADLTLGGSTERKSGQFLIAMRPSRYQYSPLQLSQTPDGSTSVTVTGLDRAKVAQRLRLFGYPSNDGNPLALPDIGAGASASFEQSLELFNAAIVESGDGNPLDQEEFQPILNAHPADETYLPPSNNALQGTLVQPLVSLSTLSWLNAQNAPRWVDLREAPWNLAFDLGEPFGVHWVGDVMSAVKETSSTGVSNRYSDLASSDVDASPTRECEEGICRVPLVSHTEHKAGLDIDINIDQRILHRAIRDITGPGGRSIEADTPFVRGLDGLPRPADADPSWYYHQLTSAEVTVADQIFRFVTAVGPAGPGLQNAGPRLEAIYLGGTSTEHMAAFLHYPWIRKALTTHFGVETNVEPKPDHDDHFHISLKPPTNPTPVPVTDTDLTQLEGILEALNTGLQVARGSGAISGWVDTAMGLDLPIISESLGDLAQATDRFGEAFRRDIELPSAGAVASESVSTLTASSTESLTDDLNNVRAQLESFGFDVEQLDINPDGSGDYIRARYQREFGSFDTLPGFSFDTGFDYFDIGLIGELSGTLMANVQPTVLDVTLGVDLVDGVPTFFLSETSSLTVGGVSVNGSSLNANVAIRNLLDVDVRGPISGTLGAAVRFTDQDADNKLRINQLTGDPAEIVSAGINQVEPFSFRPSLTANLPIIGELTWDGTCTASLSSDLNLDAGCSLNSPSIGTVTQLLEAGYKAIAEVFDVFGGVNLNEELPFVDRGLGEVLGLPDFLTDGDLGISDFVPDITADTISKLINGEVVDLISFSTPPNQSIGFSESFSVPILAAAIPIGPIPLAVSLSFDTDVEAGVSYHVGLGVDTLGFYIDPKTFVSAGGSIQAGLSGEASIAGIAGVEITAGVGASINASIRLEDPDPRDGKIYLDELLQDRSGNTLSLGDALLNVVDARLSGEAFGFAKGVAFLLFLRFEVFNERFTIAEFGASLEDSSEPARASQNFPNSIRSVTGRFPYLDGESTAINDVVSLENGVLTLRATQGQAAGKKNTVSIDDLGLGEMEVAWRGIGRATFQTDDVTSIRYVGNEQDDRFYVGARIDNPVVAEGGDGNDLLTVVDAPAELRGGNGDDLLRGGSANDVLQGGPGDDRLEGNEGSDVLYGGTDSSTGGDGNDRLEGGDGDDQLFGQDGVDILLGDDGNDTLSGGAANDVLHGGFGNDHLLGDAGNDVLFGQQDNDVLSGGADDDTLVGGSHDDTLRGDSGNDMLVGDNGKSDPVPGEPEGNDRLFGGDGDDMLFGDGGSDQLFGDRVDPQSGDPPGQVPGEDLLVGGDGADELFGDQRDDQLLGGTGEDTLNGGEGNDLLNGQGDADLLNGDNGDDTLQLDFTTGSDNATDELHGGDGRDRLAIAGTQQEVTSEVSQGVWSCSSEAETCGGNTTLSAEVDDYILLKQSGANDFVAELKDLDAADPATAPPLAVLPFMLDGSATGDIEELSLQGLGGDDRLEVDTSELAGKNVILEGGEGDDTLLGGDGRDVIYGGPGDDVLRGFGNRDVLYGEEGRDDLEGGAGVDALYSGPGADLVGGGYGPENIKGGPGDDYLVAGVGFYGSLIEGGPGNDIIIGNEGPDILNGEGSGTPLSGDRFDDIILGGGGNDEIDGGPGNDLLIGELGRDSIEDADTESIVDGVVIPNDDRIFVHLNNEVRIGLGLEAITEPTPEELLARREQLLNQQTILRDREGQLLAIPNRTPAEDDELEAIGDALDVIDDALDALNPVSGRNRDTARGGVGDDQIHGSPFPDSLFGGPGNDSLFIVGDPQSGGNRRDDFQGESGEDTLWVDGTDNDDQIRLVSEPDGFGNLQPAVDLNDDGTIDTGLHLDQILEVERLGVRTFGGNDSIWIDFNTDMVLADVRIEAGSGDDVVEVVSPMLNSVDIDGGSGDDWIIGGPKADRLVGGPGNDILVGGDGDDLLEGNAGDDELNGGAGNDQLFGGLGDDFLFGGEAASTEDRLFGGDGDDVLVAGAGDDLLDGGSGNDRYDGGAGANEVVDKSGSESLPTAGNDVWNGTGTLKGGNLVTIVDNPLGLTEIKHYDSATWPDGSFLVAWAETDNTHVLGQRYSASGEALDERIVFSEIESGDEAKYFFLDAMPNGNFVVAWRNASSLSSTVRARVFDPNGNAMTDVVTADGPGHLVFEHTVKASPDNGFIIAWYDYRQDNKLFVKRFDSSGTALTAAIPVFDYEVRTSEQAPGIDIAADGSFAVSWIEQHNTDDFNYDEIRVFTRVFNPTNVPITDPIQIRSSTIINPFGFGYEGKSAVTMGGTGFIVTWEEEGFTGKLIQSQKFELTGQQIGNVKQVVPNGGELIAAMMASDQRVTTVSYGPRMILQAADGTLSADADTFEDIPIDRRDFDISGDPVYNTSIDVSQDAAGNVTLVWRDDSEQSIGYFSLVAQRFDRSTPTPIEDKTPNRVTTRSVFFAEPLSEMGQGSVTDGSNWTVAAENGSAIHPLEVRPVFDSQSGVTEYRLIFDRVLAPGEYVLTASGMITDLLGRGIDGNADGIAGDGYHERFTIGEPPVALGGYQSFAEVPVDSSDVSFLAFPNADDHLGFVATWSAIASGGTESVFVQRFDVDGVAVGAATQVNTLPGFDALHPRLTMNADGDYAVAWDTKLTFTSNPTYFASARRFQRDGSVIDATPIPITESQSTEPTFPMIASRSDGGLWAAWQHATPTGGFNVLARGFDLDGTPLSAPHVLNTNSDSPGGETHSLAADATGTALLTWISETSEATRIEAAYLSDQDGFEPPLIVAERDDNAVGRISSTANAVGQFAISYITGSGTDSKVVVQNLDRRPLRRVASFDELMVGSSKGSVRLPARDGFTADVWIDFNGDGSFGGKDEYVVIGVALAAEPTRVPISVPSSARPGDLTGRVVLTTAGNQSTAFQYLVEIEPPARGGEFLPEQTVASSVIQVRDVVAGDLDGDGDVDLLSGAGTGNLGWHENMGGNQFAFHLIDSQMISPIESVLLVDLDRDGDLDAVRGGGNLISWFINDGTGSFGAETVVTDTATVAMNIREIEAADMDGDGNLDLLSVSADDDKLLMFKNLGAGVFDAPVTISTSRGQPETLAAADVDGDGDMDVVVGAFEIQTLLWLENQQSTTFVEHVIDDFTRDAAIFDIVTADVDSDGDIDIVVTQESFLSPLGYRNQGNGDFTFTFSSNPSTLALYVQSGTQSTSVQTGAGRLDPADIDGNGALDFVFGSDSGDPFVWASANFGSPGRQVVSDSLGIDGAFAMDSDNDGDLDLIAYSRERGLIQLFESDATPVQGDSKENAPDLAPFNASTEGQTLNPNTRPDITLDADGNLLVSWLAANGDVIVRWYDHEGNVLTDDLELIGATTADPNSIHLITKPDGESWLTWTDGQALQSQRLTRKAPTTISSSADIANNQFRVSFSQRMAEQGIGSVLSKSNWALQLPDGRFIINEIPGLPDGNVADLPVKDPLATPEQLGEIAQSFNSDTGTWDVTIGFNFALVPGQYRLVARSSLRDVAERQLQTVDNRNQVLDLEVTLSRAITGTTFLDVDGDGEFDGDETVIAGRIVYLDANGNGRLDVDESMTQSLSDGTYRFLGLPDGEYAVAQLIPDGYRETLSAMPVTIGGDSVVSGVDFGSQFVGIDFGDAPASYRTGAALDAARHNAIGPILGLLRDAESDGVADVATQGDDLNDLDDEDGVDFGGPAYSGGSNLVEIFASNVGAEGAYVNAWIDTNRDSDFTDSGEHIIRNARVFAGVNDLRFTLGDDVTSGAAIARFRISSLPDLTAKGLATDGEVEDHPINIVPAATPTVEQIVINRGSANRSQVTSLAVMFSEIVDVSASAFRITNQSTGKEVTTLDVSSSVENGRTTSLITFIPGESVHTRANSVHSLAEGVYRLDIIGTEISVFETRRKMDGDIAFGNEETDRFFRFFGDSDGDGDVDGQDYGRFGLSFLRSPDDPEFNSDFDFDGDGDVDGQDYGQFGLRFLRTI